MISRKKLVDYLRTLPEYSIELSKPHIFIVQDSGILGEILVDFTDFGAVIQIFDNRAPHEISDLLSHFTYEVIHTASPFTLYRHRHTGQYLVKLLDFRV